DADGEAEARCSCCPRSKSARLWIWLKLELDGEIRRRTTQAISDKVIRVRHKQAGKAGTVFKQMR
ncbi:jg24656, partial [Pararge aegeria aegeria]